MVPAMNRMRVLRAAGVEAEPTPGIAPAPGWAVWSTLLELGEAHAAGPRLSASSIRPGAVSPRARDSHRLDQGFFVVASEDGGGAKTFSRSRGSWKPSATRVM